jgi:hypothetical protein
VQAASERSGGSGVVYCELSAEQRYKSVCELVGKLDVCWELLYRSAERRVSERGVGNVGPRGVMWG